MSIWLLWKTAPTVCHLRNSRLPWCEETSSTSWDYGTKLQWTDVIPVMRFERMHRNVRRTGLNNLSFCRGWSQCFCGSSGWSFTVLGPGNPHCICTSIRCADCGVELSCDFKKGRSGHQSACTCPTFMRHLMLLKCAVRYPFLHKTNLMCSCTDGSAIQSYRILHLPHYLLHAL